MIRPLKNQLLIRLLPKEQTSEGGIHLVERYQPDQLLAYVIAAGPGWRNKKGVLFPPEAQPGHYVLLDKFSLNAKLEVGDGTNLWLIDADHVSLVVESEEVRAKDPEMCAAT